MDKRFFAFLAISLVLLVGYQLLLSALGLRQPPAPPKAAKKPPAAEKKVADGDQAPAIEAAGDDAPEQEPAPVPVVEVEEKRVTLGSLDPASPFQMLVTITNTGAAVERIELNDPRFGDLPQYDKYELPGGYMGSLALTKGPELGAVVQAVGPGTPAAKAGLKPGDVITKLGAFTVKSPADLQAALEQLKPGTTADLLYSRGGAATTSTKVTLTQIPVSVVRPEKHGPKQDPLSFLMSVPEVDGKPTKGPSIRNVNWELVDGSLTESTAEFKTTLPSGLIAHKRFELAKVDKKEEHDHRGYGLTFAVSIENPTDTEHKAVYHLQGPTGLPTEAWWYGSKKSPYWRGGAGIRDIVADSLEPYGSALHHYNSAMAIAAEEKAELHADYLPLLYAGVDAQYFSVVMTPDRKLTEKQYTDEDDPWFEAIYNLRVGPVPAEKAYRKVVDTTFRLESDAMIIPPNKTVTHKFQVFAGPKDRDILAQYGPPGGNGLEDLVEYGWFWWVARPMSRVLQFFHWLTGNWGLAIVMLTVLVRSCMFPISRKQALGAQKMQMLSPEIKKIAEKYKTNPEQRMKAQQELFRQHNYNPLAGCLPLFLQMPVFIGLYSSLMVNVELRQAPLIRGWDWCSNLAAPDALWNWTGVMPDFLVYYLGPHLNILPLVTVALFLWQQKLFMPPPADEQAVMQQKMMQYMMIFMAYLFYQTASGLCLYFIASSLWGITERKLLPKTLPPAPTLATAPTPPPTKGENGQSKALDTIKSLFQNGKQETNVERDARRRRERGKRK